MSRREEFARELKGYRLDACMTRAKMAFVLGLDIRTYFRYENQKGYPNGDPGAEEILEKARGARYRVGDEYTCDTCRQDKPMEDFTVNGQGRISQCEDCRRRGRGLRPVGQVDDPGRELTRGEQVAYVMGRHLRGESDRRLAVLHSRDPVTIGGVIARAELEMPWLVRHYQSLREKRSAMAARARGGKP